MFELIPAIDKEFRKVAKRTKLEVNHISGEKLQELVNKMLMTPSKIVEKFSKAIQVSGKSKRR